MRTLPEAEIHPLEEHLLICSPCRERFQEMDVYVAAMRSAAAEIANSEKAVKKPPAQRPKRTA